MKLDKVEKFIIGIYAVIILFACGIIGYVIAEDRYKHYAIIHHAAFYEADTWGKVSFHWNDDSYAQTPFQDEMWQRIQANIAEQKSKASK